MNQNQSVASYEFWPTRGAPVPSPFLEETQPANLCVSSPSLSLSCLRLSALTDPTPPLSLSSPGSLLPALTPPIHHLPVTAPVHRADPLTWLLSTGQIFMQANWQTTLLNYTSGVETRLPNIPVAQKTYPASGATAMLPLTGESLRSCAGGLESARGG